MKKKSKILLTTVVVFVLVLSKLYFYVTKENTVNIAAVLGNSSSIIQKYPFPVPFVVLFNSSGNSPFTELKKFI
jgi:hypothetical protein